MSTEKIFRCECSTEGLAFSYDAEEGTVDISLWSYGVHHYGHKFDIKERLRWCWHILTSGYPYKDELILSRDTAREMANEILEKTHMPL